MKIKKIIMLSPIIALPIIVASCSSFDNRINDKTLKLKMSRDKIAQGYREGFNEFNNFINNVNNSPFGNLNSFYFEISRAAKAVSLAYSAFKDEIKKKSENPIVSKIIKDEFNGFKSVDLNDLKTLNIDVWMSKLFVINNDLQAVVENRRREWNDAANIYRTIYNLELDPNDKVFLSDKNQLIKESTQRHVDQAIVRQNGGVINNKKPDYLTMWFDKEFVIDYNNINVLLNNPDAKIDTGITNFWHTHSLGNIFNEWINVVVSDNADDKNKNSISINSVTQLGNFLNKIKTTYRQLIDVNEEKLNVAYMNLIKAYETLIAKIQEVNSSNGGKFPINNFLNFFNDKTNNTFNSGPFGKMNKALNELYDLTKEL